MKLFGKHFSQNRVHRVYLELGKVLKKPVCLRFILLGQQGTGCINQKSTGFDKRLGMRQNVLLYVYEVLKTVKC